VIARFVHHAYLLDAIVRLLVRQPELMAAVLDHLWAKRSALGIRSTWQLWRLSRRPFEVIKTRSIDAPLAAMRRRRARADAAWRHDPLLSALLHANIAEAVATEIWAGFPANARAGAALMNVPMWKTRVEPEHRVIQASTSREWASLYESWNLAFILGNVGRLELLLPKLLVPTVLCAAPAEYVHNRAIALWLSIQFYLFAEHRGAPRVELPHARQLSLILGRLNRERVREPLV
jgi:hypothetical protein